MINLNLNITNPWHNHDKYPWRDLYQGEWSVTKNKNLEVGVFFYLHTLFRLKMDIEWQGHDHAGPRFELAVLGLEFCIGLPDTRHWYHNKNRWINYSDPAEMRELYPEQFK
jgi:hypothetical protein